MRAVLFDFDFTLADSTPGVLDCFAYGFERLGLPNVEAERVRRTIGLTLEEALRILHGVDDPVVVRKFFDAFRESAADVMVPNTRFLARAIEAPSSGRMRRGIRFAGVRRSARDVSIVTQRHSRSDFGASLVTPSSKDSICAWCLARSTSRFVGASHGEFSSTR